jgi:hypothetical protein
VLLFHVFVLGCAKRNCSAVFGFGGNGTSQH